jgi:hypothetical protein
LSKICEFFDLRKLKANPSLAISDLEFNYFLLLWASLIGTSQKKITRPLEFPKNRYFVVLFYWDVWIGYKSRTYGKGYGIN